MNQTKFFFALAAIMFTISCKKEQTIDNGLVDENPITNQIGGEISFRGNEECNAYIQFKDEFCVYKTATENPTFPPPVTLTKPPSNPELFNNRPVTLLSGGQTITATMMRNLENEIDFLLQMDGDNYVLTKTNDVVIGSKALEGAIPTHLNSLYILKEELLRSELSPNDMNVLLGGAGAVSVDVEDRTTISIGQPTLLPSEGTEGLLLFRDCDWEKAVTINKYLSRIGWPNNDLSLYPFIVETAMDDCNWQCRDCLDPKCVFDGIEPLLSSQNEIEQLKNAYVRYSLGLSAEEFGVLANEAEIFESVSELLSDGGFCDKAELGIEIAYLLNYDNLIDICDSNTEETDMITTALASCDLSECNLASFHENLSGSFDWIIESKEFSECEVLKCVFDDLNGSGNSAFCAYIGEFIGTEVYGLKLEIGGFTSGSTKIIDVKNKIIRIRFNAGYCESNDHIDVAQLIIHEGIHAYFDKQLLDLGIISDLTKEEVKEAWRVFVSQNYNVQYNSQHQVMIVEYMDVIASSLRELNSNKFTDEHYMFPVWEGLELAWDDYIDEATEDNWQSLYNTVKNDPDVYKCN